MNTTPTLKILFCMTLVLSGCKSSIETQDLSAYEKVSGILGIPTTTTTMPPVTTTTTSTTMPPVLPTTTTTLAPPPPVPTTTTTFPPPKPPVTTTTTTMPPPPTTIPPTVSAVCNSKAAACTYLKTLWDNGEAAGNAGDWYENRDSEHSLVDITLHPQVQRTLGSASGFTNWITPQKVVIGNASLGVGGMWSMPRYYGYNSQTNASALYAQYMSNNHYWYPDVYDFHPTALDDYDETFAMAAYTGLTFGKSGTDRQKVNASFYTLAGFKKDVKQKLIDKGLIIPTLQMIYRRARLTTDSDYLTSDAHPSAFSTIDKDLEQIQLANSIQMNNIPPMIQMSVLAENFSANAVSQFAEPGRSEQIFTTSASIARVYRSAETARKMIISLDKSYDLNNRSLTYEFKLLRGNPANVTITKLNTSGSLVEISVKPQAVELLGIDSRTSDLIIIGSFVHNGAYFSAPGFVTIANLRNQVRNYNGNSMLATYNSQVDPNFMYPRSWTTDEYSFDGNGSVKSIIRKKGAVATEFTPEGLLVVSKDSNGKVLTASEVAYTIGASNPFPVSYAIKYTDYRKVSQIEELSYSVSKSGVLTVPLATTGISTIANQGRYGIASPNSERQDFTYTPKSNLSGDDVVLLRVDDAVNSTSKIYRIKITITN